MNVKVISVKGNIRFNLHALGNHNMKKGFALRAYVYVQNRFQYPTFFSKGLDITIMNCNTSLATKFAVM